MTSQSAATLRSRYAVQAASDLEENRHRQQELAEKLKMLQEEEALLVDIIALAEQHHGSAKPSPLPEQAQGEPAPVRGERRGKSGVATAVPRSRRTGSKEKTAAKGRSQRPLLGDLLLELLAGHGEPRLAKDLRDELLVKYPDREPTPQVVRNTLESLVAKDRVRRHKEERSVLYTLVDRGRRRTSAG
ncbi:hypothetical protein ABTZ03_42230 [Kitasatospora sp. NPDC096077]|uniref:hypothetical protein n=1 Tax=Kitasatospora sp. NPDC096077 TaxID=3155544 RepID=UPI003319DCBA